ncbi:MAG TPA: tetratricopeptide repeat protein [Steroidobacteraceae bacterium]|nr:tetratricopeptide repeat protein [Steroidobacteraceae bacterium]
MGEQADNPPGRALERGFRLDALTIDPQAGEVTGPGGREKLDPKVMDVLLVLARNAGQVVLREDLLARLWANTVVTDESLSRCIYELRRQLSLAGGDERYKAMFETVPKRGYRLNAPVTPIAPPAAEPPAVRPQRPSRLHVVAILGAIAVVVAAWLLIDRPGREQPAPPDAEPYSLAVLPFDDLSEAQDQAHFSDGISEEILNRLTNTRTVRVIGRTSSFSFRGQASSIPDIAGKLDVTHVLEGSVRKAGNRLRITARLVEAASNSQVWSESYDREIGDLFAVQDDIAGEVAGALNATLAHQAQRVPDLEAHNLFLQGEFFYNRRAPGDIERSVKYYRNALEIDPGYARAWAALAGAYSLLAYGGSMPRQEALEAQGEAARKAVDLDPNLAAGQARLAQYYFDIGDRPNSYRIFDRAIALDPDDLLVLTLAAGIAMRSGEVAEAIGRYDRLVAREPRSATYHANRGIYLQAAGRFDDGRVALEKARELNPELGGELDLAIARILVVQKQLEKARSVIDRLPEGAARDHGLALLYHAEGRQMEADAALERLEAGSTQAVDVRLAEVYAFRGKNDAAFEALEGLKEAIELNEASSASQVWSWQVELCVSPFLKPLHDDPRWPPLLVEPTVVSF